MEFGLFHEFQQAPGEGPALAFTQSFEQVDAAERMGLDAMWLAELHFVPERSVAASPLILAAAIAQRTTRMKIGTAVQVLPLCHPLRLAEEVATVDHLANGRLIFGIGRSGFAQTYAAFGVDYAESRERFAEVLDILKLAFTEDRFSYQGRFYAYDNVRLAPKPLTRPWPEIRIAAASADTYPAIGAMGHAIFVSVRTGDFSELKPALDAYRAAWRAGGHPGDGKVFLRVPVYVADTDERAREEPRESILSLLRAVGSRMESAAAAAGAAETASRAARGQRMQSIAYEDVVAERMIVGTPARVIDRLKQLEEELGLDGILAELNPGSLVPHHSVMTALRLLCEEVMPAFK